MKSVQYIGMNEGHEQFLRDIQSQAPAPPPFAPEQPKSGFSKKRVLLVLVGIIILGAIGFGLALFTNKKAPSKTVVEEPQTSQQTASPSATNDIPPAGSPKVFKSDFPRVEFTYPDNWEVIENRDQESIRIVSPEFSYTSITGTAITGKFRIYIRQGARQQDSKFIGRGVAAQPSEKLIYSAPSSNQRPETNLSFFGLDSSDNFAFFLIAGNFSLQKDEALGPEYGTEPETYIIAGGYSSDELTDDLATNPVPLEYFSTTNAYKQGTDIIKSLKIL